jgi:DNA-binding transcriptional MerR regulator
LVRSDEELSFEALAEYAGVHPEYLERLVDYGLIDPIRRSGSEIRFGASAVLRVRRISRIKKDLGVNLSGVAVILQLIDRLHELQKELEELRART